VSLQTHGSRRRSHSLSIGVQTRHDRWDKLAVLETVQMHARSRHAFAESAPLNQLALLGSSNGLVVPITSRSMPAPSIPVHQRVTSTHTLDSNHTLPPSSPILTSKTDPSASQSSIPPKVAETVSESPFSTFEAPRATWHNGNPATAITDMPRFRVTPPNSSASEFNMAIEALCEDRRPGDSLAPILETYNEMLRLSLLPSIKTYTYLMQVLTDRDEEVYKAIYSLKIRSKRHSFLGQAEETLAKQMAQLQAENHFPLALSLFETVIALKANTKIPPPIYQALLRSCSYHSNVDAAINVFAQMERRLNFFPSAVAFGHLIAVYTNVGDLQGAKEAFDEFRAASKLNHIAWPSRKDAIQDFEVDRDFRARSSQLMVWNKMVRAYFLCGQPAGALGLLEQMMDSKAGERFGPADVPPPASSTFTEIVSGFCHSGDVQTALIWFDRLLQQEQTGRHPFEPSILPPRPDQNAWTVMLDALAFKSRVVDLNRLFCVYLENAVRDTLDVRALDYMLIFRANMNDLENNAQADSVTATLDFVLDRILMSDSVPLRDHDSQHVIQAVVERCLKFQASEKALAALEKYVERELGILKEWEANGEHMTTRVRHKMSNTRVTVANSAELFVLQQRPSLEEVLRLMRMSDRVGLLPSRVVAPYYLQAYVLAKNVGELHILTMRDWETLAYAVTVVELPADENDISYTPPSSTCGISSFLEELSTHRVDLTMMHESTIRRMIKALFLRHDREEISTMFANLDPSYEEILNRPLGEPRTSHELDSAEKTGSILAYSPKPIRIDNHHSSFINEYLIRDSHVTPSMAYERYEAGLENNVYPVPTTIGRLISTLGRLGEIDKVQKLYNDSQRLLASLERDKKWQSQAWYHIEDQMIVAYAHAGDLNSAHIHRERILAQGGAPTADSYGALIECVKDTTDDTSNALALFQESQRQGVLPNIYLYNNIISKLAKARKADSALELFRQMKASHIQPSSITYGAVIAACARVGDAHSAELLFTEMTQQPNYKPRIPPFNTMMQLYTHTKPNRHRVLCFYNALLDANIRPTAHTYKVGASRCFIITTVNCLPITVAH
jgi:pentatricopeptide repeat protein